MAHNPREGRLVETLQGMTVERMCHLINTEWHFRPGWKFSATDYTKRFEQGVEVTVIFPAPNTNHGLAVVGYPVMIDVEVNFVVRVCDCATEDDLWFQMLLICAQIDMHETREFARVGPDMRAPFHPHRLEGMALYARMVHPGNEHLSILADENYGR